MSGTNIPFSSQATNHESQSTSEDAARLARRLAAFVDLSSDAIFAREPDGTIAFWSRGAEALYGWTRSEAVGHLTDPLLHPRYPEPFEGILATLEREGRWQGEVVHTRRDGSPVVVASRWQLQRGEAESPDLILETNTDSTANKRAEEALRETQRRLTVIVDSIADGFYALDREWRFTRINDAALEYFHNTREDMLGRTIFEVFPGFRDSIFEREYRRARETGEPIHILNPSVAINGTVELFGYPGPDNLTVLFRDVTEQKQAEAELRRLNRTLRALSNVNQALLRAADERDLLHEACQIIVRDCGYAMAWVGYAEHDEAHSVRPVASAGFEAGYLETLQITWADTERGRGPTGTAIRTGQVSICRDMLTDPQFLPWREQALRRGYASSIVLPMRTDGRAVGALTIYSREPNPFSDAEITLLTELTDDLMYGVNALRLRVAHAQAEQALHESEERFSQAFHSSPVGVNIFSLADGHSVDVNDAYLALVGYSREQVMGHTAAELNLFVNPEERASWIQRLRATGAVRNLDVQIRHKSGSIVNALFSIVKIEVNGAAMGLILAVDITDRKRAEEELRQQREWLRVTLTSIGDGVIAADTDARITFLNPIAAALTGWKPEQAIGLPVQSVFKIINEETHQPAEDIVGRVLNDKRVLLLANHTVLVTQKGAEIPIEDSGAPILDGDDNVRGAVIVFHDVTEKRRVQEALRESEERYRQLFSGMTEGFALHEIVVDDAGRPCDYRFLDLNPAFERLTGLRRDAIVGRLHNEVLPGDDPRWVEIYGQVALTGEPVHFENYSPALQNWYEVLAYRPAPRQFAVIFMNITDRKRAEQERTELLTREQAARSEAEAAVQIRDQFIALASHELKTPLTSMRGYAELLQRAEGLSAQHARMARTIYQQTLRLEKLISALLDISRIERGQLGLECAPVELGTLLACIVKNIQPTLRLHTLEFIPAGASVVVNGDESRFEQVLENLIQNAVKYSPSGGRIVVQLTRDAATARIAVADQGIGIPADVLPHMFTRFYRAQNATATHIGGLGVGLYVAREIVRLHGGDVEVESQEGHGSTFTVSLPLQAES